MTDPLTEMLASLKEKLRAATPGQRTVKFLFGSADLPMSIEADDKVICEVSEECVRPTPNFRYIAALDPDLVAALIGCVEALGVILAKHPDDCEHIHAGWGALAELRKLAEGRRG